MGGYAVTDELNAAIDVLMQVNIAKDKFKLVEDFSSQGNMFEQQSPVAIELAKKLEGKEKNFADFMQSMNAALEPGTSGQVDIFFGGVETKDDVLKRILNLKKSLAVAVSTAVEQLRLFYRQQAVERVQKAFSKEYTNHWGA